MALAILVGLLGGLGTGAAAAAAAQGLSMLILAAFFVIDSHRTHGSRGTALFAVILYVTAFACEALSIATGFPFGGFEHRAEGWKLLGVPPAVPLVYVVVGWTAWTLAHRIIGVERLRGAQRVLVPLAAALLLAGYDAMIDPFGGTVERRWSYDHPSGLSGVPLTNFGGWILTGYIGLQLFALLSGTGRRHGRRANAPRSAWDLVPPVLWIGAAVPYPFPFAHPHAGTIDAGHSLLAVADIYETAAIVGVFTMILPAVLAISRTSQRDGATRGAGDYGDETTDARHRDDARGHESQ